jgi:hypothetical protein
VLRTKWEAWNSFRGTSKEHAMREFLDLILKYESDLQSSPVGGNGLMESGKKTGRSDSMRSIASNASTTTSNVASNSAGIQPGSKVVKVGILYKQRDVFKGWRPRKFILCDTILHYFMEPDDPIPKKSMDISGCTITAVRAARVGEVEYYPFVISHPKSAKSYNLSSDSKAEVDDWLEKLRTAASKQDTITNFVSNPEERLLGASVAPQPELARPGTERQGAGPASGNNLAVAVADEGKYKTDNMDSSMIDVPPQYAQKVNKAVEALLNAVEPNAPNWEPLFEKNGVVAKKRAGDVICVRGDGSLPFCIPDILALLTNTDRMKEYNSQLNTSQTLRFFNNQTGVTATEFLVHPSIPYLSSFYCRRANFEVQASVADSSERYGDALSLASSRRWSTGHVVIL